VALNNAKGVIYGLAIRDALGGRMRRRFLSISARGGKEEENNAWP